MANYGNMNTANQYAGMMPYQQTAMPNTPVPLPQNDNSWSAMWRGTPNRSENTYNYTPYQMNAMNQMLGAGLQGINKANFEPIRNRVIRDYEQKIMPSIAERFTSLGAQNSSAFNSAIGQAGAELSENLADMESRFYQQNQPFYQQLMAMGLQPQFDKYISQGQGGMQQSFQQTGMKELFKALSKMGQSFGQSGQTFAAGDNRPNEFGDILPEDQGSSEGGGIPWGTIAQIGIPLAKILLSFV
jgi:hypothetical protein